MKVFLSAVLVLVLVGLLSNLVLPRIAGESSEAAYTDSSARP